MNDINKALFGLLLLLALSLNEECLASTVFEDEFTSCPVKNYNEGMHADNVMEVILDRDIVQRIRDDYEADIKPIYDTAKSTEDFCLVTPYNSDTTTWDKKNKGESDIRWYSTRNERTYRKYLAHVDRLGLRDIVKGPWIDSDADVTVYNMFIITRSKSSKHQFHVDWSKKVHTQVMTLLIPLNDFDINLAYHDVDEGTRYYNYTMGKAIAFAGGFVHSTDIGQGETEDVLLCVYLGSNDKKIWKYALKNIDDEMEYYMSPVDGYIRNENKGARNKEICKPTL